MTGSSTMASACASLLGASLLGASLLGASLLGGVLLASGCAGPSVAPPENPPVVAGMLPGDAAPRACFDRIIATVVSDFVHPERLTADWHAAVAHHRATITDETTDDDLVAILDGLVRRLGASHTRVLGRDDPSTSALRCVFSRDLRAFPRPTIGALTTPGDGTLIVTHVLDASPAARAGVRVGDVITAIDGEDLPHPVRSLAGKDAVTLTIQRVGGEDALAGGGLMTLDLEVPVVVRAQGEEHLDAQRASQRTIERDGICVGVVHLWSGTHPRMRTALAESVAALGRYADGFILDLRGGFGGAHPAYLAPFYPSDFLAEDPAAPVVPALYDRPLVALIDNGTRSGKEWLAHTLVTTGRAALVGETTAGAFLGGRFTEIVEGRIWLYLAVVEGPEGIDLEGVGVPPTIAVARDPRDPARDLPLEAAVEEVMRRVRAEWESSETPQEARPPGGGR